MEKPNDSPRRVSNHGLFLGNRGSLHYKVFFGGVGASLTTNTNLVSKPHYFSVISTLKSTSFPTITLKFTLKLFYNIIYIKFSIYHLFNCMF